jgi:nitroimidazol reductase NimA-like FMN-containing flavoprotein (pyridoxamine 5'-phosphate oxidase superfamily)
MSVPPPRNLRTRLADSRARLAEDRDCWVATAGPQGPWMIPLSFLWTADALVLATDRDSRVVKDLLAQPVVRVGVGSTRDVVIVHGRATVLEPGEVDEAIWEAYAHKLGSDPRSWADAAVLVTPERIQAWREENELQGRDLMEGGRWLGD